MLEVRDGGREELPNTPGQGGSWEEQSHIQGREQWLHFAGAAVKRYLTPKVRETQVSR